MVIPHITDDISAILNTNTAISHVCVHRLVWTQLAPTLFVIDRRQLRHNTTETWICIWHWCTRSNLYVKRIADCGIVGLPHSWVVGAWLLQFAVCVWFAFAFAVWVLGTGTWKSAGKTFAMATTSKHLELGTWLLDSATPVPVRLTHLAKLLKANHSRTVHAYSMPCSDCMYLAVSAHKN